MAMHPAPGVSRPRSQKPQERTRYATIKYFISCLGVPLGVVSSSYEELHRRIEARLRNRRPGEILTKRRHADLSQGTRRERQNGLLKTLLAGPRERASK